MSESLVIRCESCGTDNPARTRVCSSCGHPLVSERLATLSSPEPAPRAAPSPSASPSKPRSSPTSGHEGRFAPGTVLAGRYRIVAVLGRGGMGEVYRADDLTLGQPVALKFLPEVTSGDEEMLARLRGEVRIARRVSHPNVCRVYDVGEAEGLHFLSMEYVDGEDLASLLRRIGRLSADKAAEVARGVCAGLAAAHEKGVLHRDLKPANVMLDSRGHVVLTDFGLAALDDQVAGTDLRSGTPAYMSPEQLDNSEVTARSDIYALGLLLYEIFTGKRAFEARTFAEAVRSRREAIPPKPSSLVADLPPTLDRVILRCLERDPASRPPSAHAVALALPGGDPLAAALAAGETPAPQVVADAGPTTGLSPGFATAGMGAVIVGLAVVWALSVWGSGLSALGLESSPEVLTQKARETLRRLGYDATPADTAQGLTFDTEFMRYVESNDKPRPDWRTVLSSRPSPLSFWYRSSPRNMTVLEFVDDTMTPGIVTPDDPPPTQSGMVNLQLDPQGRLTYLQVIPPEKEEASLPYPAPDWAPLFAAAELDVARLQGAPPSWTSLAASDARAAWTGAWPGTIRPLRVEAAAWHGKPVFFALIGPWTRASRMQPSEQTSGEKAREALGIALILSMLVAAALLAWLNYSRGRGDRRGAMRLGSLVFFLGLALWLCRGHFVAGVAFYALLMAAIANSLLFAGLTWVLYVALEPYVRRHWPQTIISWSRLLAGRLRDPLAGRDILIGVLFGLVWTLIYHALFRLQGAVGAPPTLAATDFLLGGRRMLGHGLMHALYSIRGTLAIFFLLFLLRALLRKQWLAAIAFILLFSTLRVLGADHPGVEVPAQLMIYSVAVIVVLRFGLVSLAAGLLCADLLLNTPVANSLSTWYAASGVFVFSSVLALAAWGAYTSLAGQPLWTWDMFE
jgi:serine/threonine protein kinase